METVALVVPSSKKGDEMKKFLSGFVAAGMLLGSLSASHAITLFATMNPVPSAPSDPLQRPYIWDNATQTFSTLDTNAGKAGIQLDVQFAFLQPVPVIGTSTIDAELTISAIADGTMTGTAQPLQALVFTVTPKNAGDVYGAGILLQTVVPAFGELFSVGATAFLQSDELAGLQMSSSYLFIEPLDPQTATWSFSNIDPIGAFVAGANMYLRDTKLGGNANFSATVRNVVPEPGSVAMLLSLGVGGSLALIRRRRNR
jgi:hypothetical protein